MTKHTMQRRVNRKLVKPGKGGKLQIDGSLHRERHEVQIESLDEPFIAEDYLDWYDSDGSDLETHSGEECEEEEPKTDNCAGMASLQRLEIERQQQGWTGAPFSLFSNPSSPTHMEDAKQEYLRAVVAPLNWQQKMLEERNGQTETAHAADHIAHASWWRNEVSQTETAHAAAHISRANQVHSLLQAKAQQVKKLQQSGLARRASDIARDILGNSFTLDPTTFGPKPGPVGNLLQIAEQALRAKEMRDSYDAYLQSKRAKDMGLSVEEVAEIDSMVEIDDRQIYGEEERIHGLHGRHDILLAMEY